MGIPTFGNRSKLYRGNNAGKSWTLCRDDRGWRYYLRPEKNALGTYSIFILGWGNIDTIDGVEFETKEEAQKYIDDHFKDKQKEEKDDHGNEE